MRRFLVVAFGLAWLVTLPVWLSGRGVDWPLMPLFGILMMTTPTLGVLAAVRAERRRRERAGEPALTWRQVARDTGLGWGTSRRRTLIAVLIAWLGVPALVVLATALSAALGLVRLDLTHFSNYGRLLADSTGGKALPLPVPVLAAITIAEAFTVAPVINTAFALGEEWGWRGWLLPRLTAARGTTAGLLLSGVIWGLWHFPLTLQGYNYPALHAWAAPYFVVFCILFAVPIGYLRLATGSVWPAAVAHGALNASAGLVVLVADVATPPRLHLVGLTGLVGWALLAVLALTLLRTARRTLAPQTSPAVPPTSPSPATPSP